MLVIKIEKRPETNLKMTIQKNDFKKIWTQKLEIQNELLQIKVAMTSFQV